MPGRTDSGGDCPQPVFAMRRPGRDLDCILDAQLWKPGAFEGAKGLYNWRPPPPPSIPPPRGPCRP